MEILRCENVTKIYDNGETQLKALDDVSLYVDKGEFVAIVFCCFHLCNSLIYFVLQKAETVLFF
jgi:predicted ABC-type transport system involved in lysophospholipase L1 biosynthesis ATPase subunit